MLTLKASIGKVPLIGPKYEKILNEMEIYSVADLLYYAPYRYDDYSTISSIQATKVGDSVTVQGTILKITNIYTKYGKRLTLAKICDATGELDVIWFNQHYLTKTLKQNDTYYFGGKIQLFSNKKTLISPTYESVKEDTLNTGRLVPIYSESKNIKSKWLRTRINDIITMLANTNELAEYLPKKILKNNNLTDISQAINNIHFPDTYSDASNAKKRLAFDEILFELIKIQKLKEEHKSINGVKIAKKSFDHKIDALTSSLPFTLTDSQHNAINEIFEDLNTKHAMNRLLEGDVGSGKTIVAIYAAYLAYLNGYKVIYMAPTEILAKQHFDTFINFLSKFNVSIGLCTSNNKDMLDKDILIGTHALLFSKDTYAKLGLIIIDEQHRFGVKQRTKLTQMGDKNTLPNILTMTATPIPRTLALTIYADLDISTLDTTPNKDKKILTRVIPEKLRDKTYDWIVKEKKQTFIVCPFITPSEHESLENVKAAEDEYENLKKGVFKNVPIGLLHGNMHNKEKGDVLTKFREKKIQVLVATPVIEVGVDIPDATIMVIESAERYGLASLHQLRGRVGRRDKTGYCLLFMSGFNKKAYARLKNLEEISSGLKLAEIDMKYRGEGDIYGIKQSGFKRFKFVNLSDIALIENAKKEAENILKGKYSEFDIDNLVKRIDLEISLN